MRVRFPPVAPDYQGKKMSELTDKCQDPNGCQDIRFCDENKTCLVHEMIKSREFIPQGVPEFLNLLEESKQIHLKKRHDYAAEDNPFSNFERSAIIMSWFNDPVDKAFANLVGTKLARLAELRNGKTAMNESIADTCLDLFTYCGLWGAYIIRGAKRNDTPKS